MLQILISACLVGENCKWDGTNNRNQRAQPAQITIADREEDKNQKQNILQKVQREISEPSE